jgi:hypothetical protein
MEQDLLEFPPVVAQPGWPTHTCVAHFGLIDLRASRNAPRAEDRHTAFSDYLRPYRDQVRINITTPYSQLNGRHRRPVNAYLKQLSGHIAGVGVAVAWWLDRIP